MNKTLVALLATSALFLFGTAQAADEAAPATQEQSSAPVSEATPESAPAGQAPAVVAPSSEAAESTSDSSK